MPRCLHQIRGWAALAACAAALPAFAADGIRWRADFKQAAIEAQQQGKLLVVSVHTKWCGPCRQMERTTFTDPSIAELLNGRCVPVKVDGDEHPELMRVWGVTSFPTELCVCTSGPDRGKIVERMVGAKNTREYAAAVRNALGQQPGEAPAERAAVASARPQGDGQVVTVAHNSADDLPLGCEGRCPVAMVEKQLMVLGQASETLVHDNMVWRFASREAKQKFLLDPAKYLPGEKGRCVVSFQEHGRWQPGDLKFPALYLDRVYFLADEAARKRFLADPEKYLDARGAARPRG